MFHGTWIAGIVLHTTWIMLHGTWIMVSSHPVPGRRGIGTAPQHEDCGQHQDITHINHLYHDHAFS